MSNSHNANTPRRLAGFDAGLGPAQPLSLADTKWLVEQVVQRALEPEHKLLPRRFRLRALSLVALGAVTSAAAATLVHQKLQQNVDVSAPAVNAPQRQPKIIARSGALQHPVTEPSASVAKPAVVPTAVNETKPLFTSPSNTVVPAPEAPEVAAVDELSAANDLRRKAQWQAAEAAYRGIAAHYPRAPQAMVAQLAAAELRLEHLGDAAGALLLYRAVPGSSALGVEALFGVSRAERALGNSAAEAAALRSLLDAYPTSLQADSARARLKQLTSDSADP